MKEWEKYESEIFDKFSSEFPNHNIIKNHHIIGKFSGVKRQVDIALISKMAGYDILGVVECKYFNKNVDVKKVEAFIGFIEDVGANLGIMITNVGYSDAAKNRAKVKDIQLEVLTMDELEEFHYDYEFCQLCDPGEDHPPAIINFEYGYCIEKDGLFYLFDIGRCDWCNSIHIRCQGCGAVMGVHESQYGKEVECDGGCGLKFLVEQKYVGHGMCEEEVYAGINDGEYIRAEPSENNV